jgi:hypothetical protein
LIAEFSRLSLIEFGMWLIEHVGAWIEFGAKKSPTHFFVGTTLFRRRPQ